MEIDVVDPRLVDSPRKNWVLIDVVHGGAPGDEWAMALGRWKNDGEAYAPCLALRWNGVETPDAKGSPTSRGFATWFIVPNDLVPHLMTYVPPDKLSMVRAILEIETVSAR